MFVTPFGTYWSVASLKKRHKTNQAEDRKRDIVIAAEELRYASDLLGRITGKIDVEEILGKIFSTFCIGK